MMLLKKYATFMAALSAILFLPSVLAHAQPAPISKSSAHESREALGAHPYLGWSSWSLQATTYPGYGTSGGADYKRWLTAEHVKAQADVVHAKLQAYGYRYINLDSGWRSETFDAHGRPQADPVRFPQGIADLAAYVHRLGLKLGVYYNPGLPEDLYRRNPPIFGTSIHLQDITMMPLRHATGWNSNWRIDFAKPGAQAYIDSIAEEFAEWGVDFLKLDGVTPGSDRHGAAGLETDGRDEVAAWDRALKATGRPIWLELSWDLDPAYLDFWSAHANGWRTATDIETYGPTLTAWYAIRRRFDAAPRDPVLRADGTHGWSDMDSVDVACGAMDGLTLDERQAVVTLWAISAAPLYTGDDLTRMDDDGLRLLTNREVLAVDQAGQPAHLLRLPDDRQVRWTQNADGSVTVALFNLSDKPTAPSATGVSLSDLGLSNAPLRIRDLWTHTELTALAAGARELPAFTLPPHGARLLRISQDRTTPAK